VFHNRRLPEWLHRLCNAALGFFLAGTVFLCIDVYLIPPAFQMAGLFTAIVLTVLTTLALVIVNPKRFSIVEGIAGDVGYNDLPEDQSERREP
jgi:hypothetical protein